MEDNNRNRADNGKLFSVMRFPSANGPSESLDNLVAITARSAYFKKRDFYKKVLILLVILIITLLIGLIVTLFYYINAWKDLRKLKICTSKECLRSAANLKLSMDVTVDACDDFYQFTCGHWTDQHPNHGWYPHFSSFESINERIAMATLKFFNTNSSEDEPVPVKQSRQFFEACLNTEAANKLGYSVIYKYLQEVNLPLVPNYFNSSNSTDFRFDWIKTEVALKKTFAMDTFIGFIVDANIYNRTTNVMYMGMPGSSCPLPSPFRKRTKQGKLKAEAEKNEEFEKKRKAAFKRVIKEVMRTVIANISKAPDDLILEKAAEEVLNISLEVAEMANLNYTTDEIDLLKMKVTELQNTTDQFLRNNNEKPEPIWERYITLLFDGVPDVALDLNGEDFLYIPPKELDYLSEVAEYIVTMPDLILELYMWWVTVYAMIINTTTEIATYISKEAAPFSISPTVRSRSVDCSNLAIDFMGIAVSYGIVDKTFLNSTKPKVEQMLNDIKDAFVARVNDLTWMDKYTKEATLDKSKEMISFIGFPEWLLVKGALEAYYGNLVIKSDTYLENMMSMIKIYTPYRLASLRNESERTWRTDPTTVNAYNHFSDNSITVPMAILTYPFYHLGLEVLNYGAIGSILGHELTHGFDNTGRKFDKYGNYIQWWSNATINTFESKTQCFIDQYNNYTVPPVKEHIRGQNTLGENLADNGGLHHAYAAYKKFIKRYGPEEHLPGFEEFTSDQMFFIAFGSIWCETPQNANSLLYQIENDEHCPNYIRVMGTLQNSHEFATAFNCPVGSDMNPKGSRCRIW